MHKLDVFDFDGTLFRTPLDTPENRRKYELDKGLPWVIDKTLARKLSRLHGRHIGMRRGWWGRKETLEPPLVPDPTPPEFMIQKTCEAFLKSKDDPNAVTMILTGRYLGLQHHVLRILGDMGLVEVTRSGNDDQLICHNVDPKVTCIFLGADGPAPSETKPSETLPWKIWILEQYLLTMDFEAMEIWEDRSEHVEAFSNINWGLKVIVHHITDCEGV